MRIHAVLHADFEKLGAIETWAKNKQYPITITHIYANEKLPQDIHAFDFLIFMGGPQSPLELDKYPYIKDEILLAKQAIAANKLVFGVCLGAQIIAEALGAQTQRSPHREIGHYPVTVLPEGLQDPFFAQLAPVFDAIHWHNDMPGIPKGGVLLAESAGCPQQAFRYGKTVYGFQFHLEPTLEMIEEMIVNCPNDLQPGAYIRTIMELKNYNYQLVNNLMNRFLDYMESIYYKEVG